LFSFGFINLKLKKPNRTQTEKNRAKLEKTEPNRFEPVFFKKPHRTETGWFEPVSVFLFKNNFGLVTFFNKNQTETKKPSQAGKNRDKPV
jgi:hypothetical protein